MDLDSFSTWTEEGVAWESARKVLDRCRPSMPGGSVFVFVLFVGGGNCESNPTLVRAATPRGLEHEKTRWERMWAGDLLTSDSLSSPCTKHKRGVAEQMCIWWRTWIRRRFIRIWRLPLEAAKACACGGVRPLPDLSADPGDGRWIRTRESIAKRRTSRVRRTRATTWSCSFVSFLFFPLPLIRDGLSLYPARFVICPAGPIERKQKKRRKTPMWFWRLSTFTFGTGFVHTSGHFSRPRWWAGRHPSWIFTSGRHFFISFYLTLGPAQRCLMDGWNPCSVCRCRWHMARRVSHVVSFSRFTSCRPSWLGSFTPSTFGRLESKHHISKEEELDTLGVTGVAYNGRNHSGEKAL